jgi:hypothetical protein
MGTPGWIDIEISTTIDEQSETYSRNLKLVNWMGLNGLSFAYNFMPKINSGKDRLHKMMKRFIDIPDGQYRMTRVKQPSDDPYDYEWEIVDKDYDDGFRTIL